MKQYSATILSNTPIADDFYELRFSWDTTIDIPQPGQFITIRISDATVPLLRRPFAAADYDASTNSAAVLYKKIGPATELLSAKTSNDKLDCIGPLGNTFALPANKSTLCILMAGGTGLGPIVFLNKTLKEKGYTSRFIFGCRSKSAIPTCKIFLDQDPVVCTDDGSSGSRGTVADYLQTLPSPEVDNTQMFCCGPTPMLKACNEFALQKKLLCQVSVEQVMACGVGACMGCVVKIVNGPGYARACKEGPVFDGKEIAWT